MEDVDGLGWEELVAGAGAEDGVKDDGDGGVVAGGLIPCRRVPFLGPEAGEKTRD